MEIVGKEKPWIGKSEESFQMQVARYLDYRKVLWCHVANERQTSPMRGAKLKKMGVKSGVPDILIFNAFQDELGAWRPGVAIELKKGKRSKPTTNQILWLTSMEREGWACYVAYNLDSIVNIVDNILIPNKLT